MYFDAAKRQWRQKESCLASARQLSSLKVLSTHYYFLMGIMEV